MDARLAGWTRDLVRWEYRILKAAGAWLVAIALGGTMPAGAQTIPTGTSPSDDLLVNFDTSHFSAPAQGMFTVYLEAPDLEAGRHFVVDVFAGANGRNLLGVAYSGPLVWVAINCRIGDGLCNALLDGDFSVGIRMESGSANLSSAYAFAVDQNQVPTNPIFGAPAVLSAPPGDPVPPTANPPAIEPVPLSNSTTAITAVLLLVVTASRRWVRRRDR